MSCHSGTDYWLGNSLTAPRGYTLVLPQPRRQVPTWPQHPTPSFRLRKSRPEVASWVAQVAQTDPAGSRPLVRRLSPRKLRGCARAAGAQANCTPLNDKTFPDCYLHRSHPSDVARVEHLTFICTRNQEDAGPNNNWMAPAEAHAKMRRAVRRLHARPHDVRRARTAWARSTRPTRAAASRSPTAPTSCSTCAS